MSDRRCTTGTLFGIRSTIQRRPPRNALVFLSKLARPTVRAVAQQQNRVYLADLVPSCVVMLNADDVDDPSLLIPDSEKDGFQRYLGKWASSVRRVACGKRPFLGRSALLR